MQVQESETPNLLAAVPAKELNQSMGCGDIGPYSVRALAAVVGKIIRPARRKRPRRMSFRFYPFISHRRSIA